MEKLDSSADNVPLRIGVEKGASEALKLLQVQVLHKTPVGQSKKTVDFRMVRV